MSFHPVFLACDQDPDTCPLVDRIKIKQVDGPDGLGQGSGTIHQIYHQPELPGLMDIFVGMLDVPGEDMSGERRYGITDQPVIRIILPFENEVKVIGFKGAEPDIFT
jgi:hypothetical protein